MNLIRCQHCGAQLPQGTLDDLCPFCVEEAPEPKPGRTLGNCELYEEIGRGGMGVVWRGRQCALDRQVAIKTLPGGDLAGAEARSRFRTEAQAVARLKHPGIVTVYEVGEEDGMPYFVMELINGRTLSSLAAEQFMPVKLAVRLLHEAALAVSHAHSQGVLHRDLKPSNILVETSADGGRARVMDFGLAKLTDMETSATLSQSAAGSPPYMSPEQARGDDCTALTDVYGLGASLYAALTGRAPHTGESLAKIIEQVEREEPLAPRRLNSSVPADLDTICLKCLEKSPARRYPSAMALAEDLQRFLNGEPVQARPVGVLQKTWRFAKRRPWHAATVLLGIFALAGIIFSLAWRARTEHLHQQEISLLLMKSQLSEARTIVRLKEADSRLRAETILRTVMAGHPPAEIRSEARDVALAALALPSMTTEDCPGAGVTINDWTHAAGDLPHGRWALGEFHGRVSLRKVGAAEETSFFTTAPRKLTVLISFSPGGRWLAIRHDAELGIYDTTPGATQPLAFVTSAWPDGHRFNLHTVTFTPDDSAVLWLDGADVVSTALPGGQELGRWPAVGAKSVAMAASGKFVALGLRDQPTAQLRSWPDGALVHSYTGIFPQDLDAIAVAPDAQRIAGGDAAGRITVWSQEGNEAQMEFRGHSELIRGLTFSSDGRHLASVSDDGTLRLWDCAAAQLMLKFNFECGLPSLAPNLQRIGPGCMGTKLEMLRPVLSPCLHSFRATPVTNRHQTVAIHPDDESLACLTAEGFARYRLPGGQLMQRFQHRDAYALEFLPDGQSIVSSGEDISRYPLQSDLQPSQLYPPASSGWDGLATSANQKWMAAVDAKFSRFVMWPSDNSSEKPREFQMRDGSLGSLALSPDGAQAASMGRYLPDVTIFDTTSGTILKSLPLPDFHSLDWSPDGRFLAASGPSTRLWSTSDWTSLALPAFEPNPWPAGAAAFSFPDSSGNSRLVALPTDSHRIRLLSLPERTILATLESPNATPIYQLAFTNNNRWLAAATSQGQIQLWDLTAIRQHLTQL